MLVVNIYNFSVGGTPVLSEFFYPYTNSAFLGHYSLGIEFRNLPYLYLMLLGLGSCLYAISKTPLFHSRNVNGMPGIIGLAGVVLLGQLAYYFARSAYYGLLIVVPMAVILTTFYLDRWSLILRRGAISRLSFSQFVRVSVLQAVGVCCSIVLTFALLIGTNLPSCLATAYQSGKFEIITSDVTATQMADEVPKDAYTFGWGTDEVLGLAGRESNYHLLGTTDALVDPEANAVVVDEFMREISGANNILASEEVKGYVPSDFVLVKKYEVLGSNFYYYTRVL